MKKYDCYYTYRAPCIIDGGGYIRVRASDEAEARQKAKGAVYADHKGWGIRGVNVYRIDEVTDNVNHPSHYKIGEYECFTEMRALFGIDALISYCKLAVYKYRYRFTKKNGDEDLKKAGWYMRELMKLEEEKAAAE